MPTSEAVSNQDATFTYPDPTDPRGGDIEIHGPVIVFTGSVYGGEAGKEPGEDGGDVHIQPGKPGGRVVLHIPSHDPGVPGALYVDVDGLLRVSRGG